MDTKREVKTALVMAVFGMVVVCLFAGRVFGQPWLGSGTAGDPYQIWTAEDMNAIGGNSAYWDAHFELMADIDLSAYTGTSFNIIGPDWENAFAGVFDGNGHTISNFTGIQGLFGVVRLGGTIQDLGLIDPNVIAVARGNTGSLANVLREMGSTISGCYVEGGSVTGYTESAAWLNSAGGLVGKNGYATITNCYSTASVSGNESVGGLVGYMYDNSLTSSCYATGVVSGNSKVGGLVGNSEWGGEVTNCYSTGSVSGTLYVGGLVGINWQATVNNSFWDTETSGKLTSAGGTGKTTAEMQDVNTFLGAGWDFVGEYGNGPSDDWAMPIGGGYPILWWQVPGNELPPLPAFSGGTGTESDPYLISNATDLNQIGHNGRLMGKHFRLVNDIDLTGVDFFFIGTRGYGYSGVFDGNGHTISNFTSSGGLFGAVAGHNAEIRDLGLIDPNVDGGTGDYVGSLVGYIGNGTISGCYVEGASVSGAGLVGYNQGGTISNCYAWGSVSGAGLVGVNTGTITNCSSGGNVSGGGLVGGNGGTITNCYSTASVSGDNRVGGLVGNNSGTITNCYAAGSVVGAGYSVGGLVGSNRGGISNCYSTGSVSGGSYIGGLVGKNENVTITNCYATGTVSSTGSNIGGLVGENERGTIRDCYSGGTVSSTGSNIGGLVGNNLRVESFIRNCYSTASVSGGGNTGGLVGRNEGTIYYCYSTGSVSGGGAVGGLVGYDIGTAFFSFWDIQTSGQTISAGGIGLPTAQMQMESTFTVVGWDFIFTWDICEGTNYPKLAWQVPVLGDFGCPDGVDGIDLGVLCEEWLFQELSADVWPEGGDGFVDFWDWAIFADGWGDTYDIFDLAGFAEQWLKSGSNYVITDIAPGSDGDGITNGVDFAVLADNWLAGL